MNKVVMLIALGVAVAACQKSESPPLGASTPAPSTVAPGSGATNTSHSEAVASNSVTPVATTPGQTTTPTTATTPNDQTLRPDYMFTPEMALNKIHAVNVEEIAGGKLASTQAKDPRVKAFGQHMVKDHTAADKQVSELAKKMSVEIKDPMEVAWPSEEKSQMHADMSKMDALKAEHGTAFDQDYISMMVDGHARALDYLHQVQASTTTPAEVKTLVGKLIPAVEGHLKQANKLSQAMEKVSQGRNP
jgi:putative membrane protein